MSIDFSKAPKGATHYYGAEWYKDAEGNLHLWSGSAWTTIEQKRHPLNRIPDAVNSPQHYTTGSVECIDAIKASMSPEAYRGYLKGNAIKYLWRYEKKVNPVEDLKKAQWYLVRLVVEQEGE